MRNLVVVMVVGLSACGSSTTASTESGGETAPESWQDMDFDARLTYMTDVVVPTIQPEFEAYDARFADMTCATCHGTGASDGSFSMPSDVLFPIDFANFPTGDGADFMLETVTPMMVDLLDEEPFDADTGGGFGCLGCHPAAS